ncbi:hypothetical protein IQ37_01445 [Chryseobacterium piperi]|uniref:MACPF domain-containing protein n=1 Tax=Chryseobacterium piperi TaxID=558152 RepID=A0A086BLQ2_9FLAO|nr:MAC/perforin domain-containing protein [Chryseobacterium piperi]ASW75715.1 hypothetical protein CJF12_16475 [Chryseobacterium piperi]KFF29866.1 hypothetical protein IQ37_01445 [Chryseobacterium piperi]
MKKQILFCLSVILMLFLASCSTEELTNEATPESLNRLNRTATARSAGDGEYDVLGHGFNAAGEYANANSAGFQIIDIARFKVEQAARLVTDNTFAQEYVEEYGENAESYSKMVSTKVGVTAGIPLFKKTLSVAFNTSITNTNKFDAKYIYGSYNLTIKQRRFRINATAAALSNYLTPEFTQDLQNKTPQQIVNDYGTHVLVDIYTGAKMDILFQSETTNRNKEHAARVGVKAGMKSIFDVDVTNDVNTSSSNQNFSKKLSYKTRGGDPSKGLMNELNLDQNNPKINIANWQNSSTPNNSVLVDFGPNGLILIYDLVKDAAKKAQLKAYVDQYLIDNRVTIEYKNTPNLVNGNFVRNPSTDEVFFMFENELRYIQSPDTLFGLFNIRNSDIFNVSSSDLSTVKKGKDLTPDNDLKQDNNTLKIYMREGNTLRWIPNSTIYNKYRFNNNAVRKINGTSGYIIGADIQ